MVIFRKIGLLFFSSTLWGIAIIDAFLLQNSILDGEGTWASIFFLLIVLVPKCLYLINPQENQNFAFKWTKIKPYHPFYKYFEYSSYIVLFLLAIYNIFYYEFIV